MRIRLRTNGSNTNRPQTYTLRLILSQGVSYKPYTQTPMKTKDNHGDIPMNVFLEGYGEINKVIASADIDNRINWHDYHIYGDIDEIRSIARSYGVINIGVDDIISTLSTTSTNYVTTGNGTGDGRIIVALNKAINKLPVKLQDIERMIVNIWASECKPVVMSEIKAMLERLRYTLPEINLIWGVAVDPDMNEDIKITLIAVTKHKFNTCNPPCIL